MHQITHNKVENSRSTLNITRMSEERDDECRHSCNEWHLLLHFLPMSGFPAGGFLPDVSAQCDGYIRPHSIVLKMTVDGSFKGTNASWAYLLRDSNDKVINEESGRCLSCVSHNVDGEIDAVIHGVRFICHCLSKHRIGDNNVDGDVIVYIYHDYIGLAAWVTGEWRAKTDVSIRYVRDMEELLKTNKNLRIVWCKIKGHSGDLDNEYVDQLAKNALNS